jgi:uroporphyrinogen decarboxylase
MLNEGHETIRRGVLLQSMMVTNPAVLHGILDKMAAALVEYVKYQIKSGAQVVQIFDSWAHHLSPAQFEEFSMPYADRVIAEVRAEHPSVPLIFHANGGVGKLAKLQGCTADVLGLDWNTDMADARAMFPDRVLQGNVDPMVLFGTEQAIRDAVQQCCAAAGSRHILNVGHGVVQQTPEENVKLFVELATKRAVAV